MKALRFLGLATLAAAMTAPAQVSHSWARFYDGPTHQADTAAVTTTDEFGNIYVCGTQDGTGGAADFVLLKYDPFGNLLWSQPFNGLGGGQDIAAGVRYKNGFVYVVGRATQPTNWYADSDMAAIKYRADNGALVWARTYSGVFQPGIESSVDGATAVAIDNQDNVYVTGFTWEWTYTFPNSDYRTVKFSPTGDLLWSSAYHGGATYVAISDQATVIEVGEDGNIFVSGDSPGPNNGSDWATIKYNAATGAQMWVHRSPEAHIDLRGGVARSMRIGSDGALYVAGSAFNDAAGIIKYDPNVGQPIWYWVQRVGHWLHHNAFNLTENDDALLAVTYDPDVDDSNLNNNSRLIRFDGQSGAKLWTADYGNIVHGDYQGSRAVTELPNGDILLAGLGVTIPYQTRLMLLKYTASGQLQQAYINEEHPAVIETRQVFTDTFGAIIVGGQSVGPSNTGDLVTLKFLQPEPVLPPTSLATTQGGSVGTSITDVYHSENHRMSFLAGVSGFAQAVSTARVLKNNPTSLTLTLESKVNRNQVTTRVEVKNRVTGGWEIIEDFPAQLSDVTRTWTISANLGRFIDPSTGTIETRVSWLPGTTIRNSNKWMGSIDVLEWRSN